MPMTVAKRRPPPRALICSSMRKAKPGATMKRFRAACPWACRAWSGCSRWPMRRMASLPGQSSSNRPSGTPNKAGQTWRNPKLAQTLRQIAERGPDAFYNGPIADEIVGAVAKAPVNPAIMTRADIAKYRPKERTPLCGIYRAYRVCSLPPSTSGGTAVLQILGLLQRFSSAELRPVTLSSVHLISEASRLAYADRERWLGDADFVV